jgi:uncharacterized protein (TIGR02001 family)
MFRRFFAVLTTCLITLSPAFSAEVSGYLVGTTDYVYRGVTQSDGHGAIQAGVDVGFDSGFFVGAWGSTVDIPGPLDNQRDNELRLYLGYGFDIGDQFRIVLNAVDYSYPGSDGDLDYDNQELSISLGYTDQYWIEYAYSPDLYDLGIVSHNVEFFAEWPLGKKYLLSAGVGHYQVDWRPSIFDNESLYWQVGITRSFSVIDLDLRYHEADKAVWFTSNDDRIGSRIAFSVRLAF